MSGSPETSCYGQTLSQIGAVGLIGAGIQASRSPHLHECEARATGIVCSYQLIDLARLGVGVESLPQLLDAAQQRGLAFQ